MERQFQISEKGLQAVVNYLGTRPYKEVWELIAHLQTIPEIKTEAKDKIKEKVKEKPDA